MMVFFVQHGAENDAQMPICRYIFHACRKLMDTCCFGAMLAQGCRA